MENLSQESPLVEHHLEHHRGEPIAFQMKVLKFIPSPLWRQAREAFMITNSKADLILNRKGEWGQNLPPTLVLEGEQCKGKRKRGGGGPPSPAPRRVRGVHGEPVEVGGEVGGATCLTLTHGEFNPSSPSYGQLRAWR